ncbi:SPOR domain-containing protein [Methylophilus sp. QUAN]|uniref:SPOR domain-containing protein n=1 Tax=Methylophilus sp. QUAN TaxID=2781020 RepID=UPI00188FC14D|nr:SPOR domain-containing protein [Methylophilus sp. QUAN]MBF4991443.1 SPOR domain-containing protein [Methylophilus sp. QUAN]
MKRLFWVLLLANVAVFAYFKHDASLSAVSSLKPELHPEQIKLLNAQALASYPKRTVAVVALTPEPVSAPEAASNSSAMTPNVSKTEVVAPENKAPENKTSDVKPVEPKPTEKTAAEKAPAAKPAETHAAVQTACYEWSGFNMARVTEAASLAQQINIKTQTNMTSTGQESVRYWIYKPPLATAEAAQTKADELRKLGVEDFFIVQDDPKWRNAISFGVFRDEKLADKLMADLKNKGVKLLIKATRNGGQAVIKLQQVSPQQFASLQKSRSHFPDTVLKEISCQ